MDLGGFEPPTFRMRTRERPRSDLAASGGVVLFSAWSA